MVIINYASRSLFLESPETFRAHFGWHNFLCIFKTKASRGTKLHSYFYFYSQYNIWKDQLYRTSRSYFYEWLFGPEKFSGLSRNGPLVYTMNRPFSTISSSIKIVLIHGWYTSRRNMLQSFLFDILYLLLTLLTLHKRIWCKITFPPYMGIFLW